MSGEGILEEENIEQKKPVKTLLVGWEKYHTLKILNKKALFLNRYALVVRLFLPVLHLP